MNPFSMSLDQVNDLSDSDLQNLASLDVIVEKAKAIQRNRRLQKEAQAERDRIIQRRNLSQSINDSVNLVKEIKEYNQLLIFGSLIAYAMRTKKADQAALLSAKANDILSQYGLNDPRILAHLVNAGSQR